MIVRLLPEAEADLEGDGDTIGRNGRTSRKRNIAKRAEQSAVPLTELLPDTDEERRYWTALGRLIQYVSLAELALNLVAVKWAGITTKAAKALFMPARVDQATNLLHRIIETKRLRGAKVQELRDVLQQLGQINRVRNDLVHLGGQVGNGRINISNKMFARSSDRLRRMQLSFENFEEINKDLRQIIWILLRLSGTLDRADPSSSGYEGKSFEGFKQVFRQASRKPLGTWNYKPRQLSPRRRKTVGKPQAQRRPRESFRE